MDNERSRNKVVQLSVAARLRTLVAMVGSVFGRRVREAEPPPVPLREQKKLEITPFHEPPPATKKFRIYQPTHQEKELARRRRRVKMVKASRKRNRKSWGKAWARKMRSAA